MENYPIPYHPSWDVRDSSKLSDDFQTCERRYFFRHLLGWKLATPSNDLVFGEAGHASFKYLLNKQSYSEDAVVGAFNEFLKIYRPQFPEDTDELYGGKTPDGWLNALAEYTVRHADDFDKYEVLYVEIAGSVTIAENRVLHFRMDSVLRERATGLIVSLDHKTKKGDFNRQWMDKFQLSIQTGTYTHCLYCLYPIKEVKGMIYNGVALKFLKTKGHVCDFKRVPAYLSPNQMQVWLWNINDIVDRLDFEMEKLSECKESDEVLMAFPMRTENCTKYYGCPYHDFCCTWSNPLRHCHEVPMGFMQEFWDPREKEETADHKMNLKYKGGKDGQS